MSRNVSVITYNGFRPRSIGRVVGESTVALASLDPAATELSMADIEMKTTTATTVTGRYDGILVDLGYPNEMIAINVHDTKR